MSNDQSELLRKLRIDPTERDAGAEAPRRIGIWIGTAVAVLALAGALIAWRAHARPVVVQTATAQSPANVGGPSAILQASGYVTARREATVSAQITGTLKAVLIEEGEHVQAGQVLARLDDAAYQAGVAQAQAQLLAAEALATQFQAQLAQARRDNQRNADLIGQNLVSHQALETTQTQVATLEAQALSQRKQVELAAAGLRSAQVQLDYCTVRAPFSGVIIAKAAQPGEIISPISAGGGFTRTGVGTIVDMDSLEIEVDVNEAYIHRVQPGQPSQAVLDAYPDWNIPAHVIAIIPTADRNKATVKVRVGLDQKDPRVLPDMGVKVSFLDAAPAAHPAPAVDGVLVPADAVVGNGATAAVFVIDGDYARARTVTAGTHYGDFIAVKGIEAGAIVIHAPGAAGVRDGARVSTADAAKPSG